MKREIGSLLETLLDARLRAAASYQVPDARGLVKLDAMENPHRWPAELMSALSRAAGRGFTEPLSGSAGAGAEGTPARGVRDRRALGHPARQRLRRDHPDARARARGAARRCCWHRRPRS